MCGKGLHRQGGVLGVGGWGLHRGGALRAGYPRQGEEPERW